MPRLLSLPVLLVSVLVLGIARGCWYYLYLEPPETYYERICACGVSLSSHGVSRALPLTVQPSALDSARLCCRPSTPSSDPIGVMPLLTAVRRAHRQRRRERLFMLLPTRLDRLGPSRLLIHLLLQLRSHTDARIVLRGSNSRHERPHILHVGAVHLHVPILDAERDHRHFVCRSHVHRRGHRWDHQLQRPYRRHCQWNSHQLGHRDSHQHHRLCFLHFGACGHFVRLRLEHQRPARSDLLGPCHFHFCFGRMWALRAR